MKKAAPRSASQARKARKPAKAVQFMHKADCATCRKARNFLKRRGYQLHFRDLWQEPLGVEDLEKLIGKRDHTEFLNTRSEAYRKSNMAENPPSRQEAIRMMARDPSLIRRPVIVAGGRVVLGFDKYGRVHF